MPKSTKTIASSRKMTDNSVESISNSLVVLRKSVFYKWSSKTTKMNSKLLALLLSLTQIVTAQTFTEMTGTPFDGVETSSIAFSDVDGDNDQDLLITGQNSSYDRTTKLYINDGLGNYTEMPDTPFDDVDEGSIAFSDVDGDGDQDLIITGANSANEVITKLYTNDGLGNYTEVLGTPFDSVWRSSIAFSDVDGDDDEDLLITGQSGSYGRAAKLYTNDGLGNFTEIQSTPFEGVLEGSVAFSDVDGDNDQDLLITGASSSNGVITKLYTNDGLGNFTEMLDTPFENVWRGSIAFSDVDGDDDQDLLITGQSSSNKRIAKLYINDGLGNYTELLSTPFDGVIVGAIAFSDVDGDNDKDLLITGLSSSNGAVANLYINDGLGNYTEMLNTTFNGVLDSSVSFSDIDGDNDQDLLITGDESIGEQITKLYINDGPTNLSDHIIPSLNINLTPYPNPTKSNIINVSFESTENGFSTLKVYNLNGHLLSQKLQFTVIGEQVIPIDIASLPSGSYFIQLAQGERKGVVKFIVQ